MSRIPPSEQLAQLARRLAEEAREGGEAEDLTRALVRLGARKLIQELPEGEVRDFWDAGATSGAGRDRKAPATATSRAGCAVPRDGWRWTSRRCGGWRGCASPPSGKPSSGAQRCWSAWWWRCMPGACRPGTSRMPLLGRSPVSRITEALQEEFEAFARRDLSGLDGVYRFADAIYESLRRQAGCREGILVSWAILRDGSKVPVPLSLGNKERYEDRPEHFRDPVRRGLRTPLTVTTDGAPGPIRAVEAIWLEAERIRCWVHKMRNVPDKVPQEVRPVASALPGGDPGRGGSRAGPAAGGRGGGAVRARISLGHGQPAGGPGGRSGPPAAARRPPEGGAAEGREKGGAGCHRGMTQTAFTDSLGLDLRPSALKGRATDGPPSPTAPPTARTGQGPAVPSGHGPPEPLGNRGLLLDVSQHHQPAGPRGRGQVPRKPPRGEGREDRGGNRLLNVGMHAEGLGGTYGHGVQSLCSHRTRVT